MESGFSAPPVAEERAEVRDRMVRSGDEFSRIFIPPSVSKSGTGWCDPGMRGRKRCSMGYSRIKAET